MAYLWALCFKSPIDTTMLDASFVSLFFSGWQSLALSMPQLMYIFAAGFRFLLFSWSFNAYRGVTVVCSCSGMQNGGLRCLTNSFAQFATRIYHLGMRQAPG
jgi:hypothetical protein